MTRDQLSFAVDSPVGRLVLESDGESLTGIALPPASRDPGAGARPPAAVLVDAARQLAEYFSGARTSFDLPLRLEGTAFQQSVWAELTKIDYGTTITYGELARRVGRPRGYRAVGQANGRNPVPIVVPCHRVVASDGIGGYSAGVDTKRALLRIERWEPATTD